MKQAHYGTRENLRMGNSVAMANYIQIMEIYRIVDNLLKESIMVWDNLIMNRDNCNMMENFFKEMLKVMVVYFMNLLKSIMKYIYNIGVVL